MNPAEKKAARAALLRHHFSKKTTPSAVSKKTTRTIAGHRIKLTEGVRYIASRPMAERSRKTYPVIISKWPLTPYPLAVVTVRELSYEEANRLVNAFNNGATSLDGRVW